MAAAYHNVSQRVVGSMGIRSSNKRNKQSLTACGKIVEANCDRPENRIHFCTVN